MPRVRTRLEVALSPEQLQILDNQSQSTGIPKAALLREWAFNGSKLPKGPSVYSDAVEAAASVYSGIPRATMESIVSAVIISLNNQ